MHHRLTRWIAPLVLVTFVGAARPSDPAHFSMTLMRENDTWRATCETGCSWTALSAHKAWFQSQRVQIDNSGVYTSATTPDPAATFAFLVTTDGSRGWKARSLRGTSWQELSFACGNASCRTRITEAGVTGPE